MRKVVAGAGEDLRNRVLSVKQSTEEIKSFSYFETGSSKKN
jgi:hypothetical protein